MKLFKATASYVWEYGHGSHNKSITRIIEAETKEEVEAYWDQVTKKIQANDPVFVLWETKVEPFVPDAVLNRGHHG